MLATILLLIQCVLASGCENPSYLACAFNGIVKTFSKLSGEVMIANYGSVIDVVESLVINLKAESIPFRIKNHEMIDSETIFTVNESSIMTFNSMKKLNDFNKKVNLTNVYASPFKFFVHCENATFDEISRLNENDIEKRKDRKSGAYHGEIQNEMTEILQYQYFIIDEEISMSLATFVWYTPEKCSEPQLVEINSFDKETKKWKNSNFVMRKFENFHGCRLMFGVSKQGPASSYQIYDEDVVDYWGYQLKLIEGLSNSLNFRYSFNPFIHETNQFYFKNSSVDLMISQFMINTFQEKWFYSQPYMFLNHYIAVPPRENYSRFEKLILPFNHDTWTMIISSFFTSYATIIVLNCLNEKIKQHVLKSSFKPSFNIVAIFFGISQLTFPRQNVARFLVMLFLIYGVILCTVCDSEIFAFLERDLIKPGVQSIKEMIKKNFTLYFKQNIELYKGMDLKTR